MYFHFHCDEVEMEVKDQVQKILDVKEMLQKAAKMEEESAKEYNEWANQCAANADSVFKEAVFEDLVIEEERHYDQYDTELDNMAKFEDKYLALQSIERSKTRAAAGAAE
jgi:bacterioferritin